MSIHLWQLAIVFSVLELFILYLAYCAINAAKKNGKLEKTPLIVRWICKFIWLLAAILDLLFNITFGSLLFRELWSYKHPLFTQRCEKFYWEVDTWRGTRARWFCDGWLNPFEAGHCG